MKSSVIKVDIQKYEKDSGKVQKTKVKLIENQLLCFNRIIYSFHPHKF